MVIKTYPISESDDKVRVFFTVKDNQVVSIHAGNQFVPVEQGFQFYVDDYVAEQIEKCELYLDGLVPKLRVKEGKTLFVPEKNDEYYKQKEIEELEKRLKELKGDEDNEV